VSTSEPNGALLRATAEAEGSRLDLFIAKALHLSRAEVKRLFEEGRIDVNGRRARKGDAVRRGQNIRVALEAPTAAVVPQPEARLSVLHLDTALVFLDKPAGMPSHPLKRGELGTLANALVARFPECNAASDDPREGGLCHRLDVETSGVIVAARDRETWRQVRHAFSHGIVDKRYLALVAGPIADAGEIDVPLRHRPTRSGTVVEPGLPDEEGARRAESAFVVLARAGDYSLVEVRIITGVLHQVRAHLAAVGAPVVGDARYGGREDPTLRRLFLHARSLQLGHPQTSTQLKVESPLPSELARALGRLGIPSL
jgi:23S rRNA pseudouridine1911/1915/1917 synthase